MDFHRHIRCGPLSRGLPAVALAFASPAYASFLAGETLDTAANVLAWVVLFLVPAVGIAVFWIVHVMPEKIAHKRHHPQTQAIHTLCLLSLVFGGLLWPLAWLWAYTKPIGHKAAYGTDKSEDYFLEAIAKAHAGTLGEHELAQLDNELDEMQARASMTPQLRKAWMELREARGRAAAGAAPAIQVAAGGSA